VLADEDRVVGVDFHYLSHLATFFTDARIKKPGVRRVVLSSSPVLLRFYRLRY
jgi:hypothetical protein